LTPKLKNGVKMNRQDKKNAKPKEQKIIRHFSEDLKKTIVKEFDNKKLSINDIVQLYEVSKVSVYKWLMKYSHKYQKGVRMVLELESEGSRIESLMKRLSETERTVGQKQMEIEFLKKVIDLCSEELGYDVKKNFTKQLNIIE
jgi:transposase-like protein